MESRLREYYEKQSTFNSFQGKGGRIDGKKKGTKGVKHTVDLEAVYKRGVPNYDWDGKTLNFIRNGPIKATKENDESTFASFSGSGQAIKKKKNRNQ